MNYPHLHLMVNHLPILGTFFVLVLLLWGLARRSPEIVRGALIATLFLAAAGWATYFTGDEAHEQLEELPGYDHDRVHEHEEGGEAAYYALLVTGALAGVGLFLGRGGRGVPAWSAGLVVVGLAASGGLAARAGLSGGEIQHEEIRGPLTEPPKAPVLTSQIPADSAAAMGHADGEGTVHRHDDGTEHVHDD